MGIYQPDDPADQIPVSRCLATFNLQSTAFIIHTDYDRRGFKYRPEKSLYRVMRGSGPGSAELY
jgi:hypothetical protein